MKRIEREWIPDDWTRLPSGLVVKVWTAAELSPERRQIVRAKALQAFDDMGYDESFVGQLLRVRRQAGEADPHR